jgi:hypothetical protein
MITFMEITRCRVVVYSLLLAAAFLLSGGLSQAEESSAILLKMVVKVDDRDRAAESLVNSAERFDGYFTRKSRDAVVLRLPSESLKPLLADVDGLGEVISRRLRRDDVSTQLLQKRAALKAKTDTQEQYLKILKKADTEGSLYVEGELIHLVAEIENLKGQIRHLQHRVDFSVLEVDFDYRDRSAPVANGRSSFAWLNTMNLNDLLEDF